MRDAVRVRRQAGAASHRVLIEPRSIPRGDGERPGGGGGHARPKPSTRARYGQSAPARPSTAAGSTIRIRTAGRSRRLAARSSAVAGPARRRARVAASAAGERSRDDAPRDVVGDERSEPEAREQNHERERPSDHRRASSRVGAPSASGLGRRDHSAARGMRRGRLRYAVREAGAPRRGGARRATS